MVHKRIAKLFLTASMLMFCMTITLAQSRTVTGTVTDAENGETLPGATVSIKGTSMRTITDLDGKYEINVEGEDKILLIEFPGMASKEVEVGDRTVIDIELGMIEELQEVVITALGISRDEKSLGYAVEEVSSESLNSGGDQNVIQGLQGKAAGVVVTGSNGTPGASSKILIRGKASISLNNQPLIVIDGVPVNNNSNSGSTDPNNVLEGVDQSNRAIDINPADIESVSILKGPAAAVLYGSRAANGVILYTTKRGAAGKLRGTVSTSQDLAWVFHLPERQFVYGQGYDGVFVPDLAFSWGPNLDAVGGNKFNQEDLFYQTGWTQNYNVSASGGGKNTIFRGSFGYTTGDGTTPNSSWKRTTARLNASFSPNDKLEILGRFGYTQSGGNRVQKGSNLSGIALSLLRAPIDADMKGIYEQTGENINYFPFYDNIYWSVNNNLYQDNVNRMLLVGEVNYWLPYDIKTTYRVGYDWTNDIRKKRFAHTSNSAPTGAVGDYRIQYGELNQDLFLVKSFRWNKVWTLDATAGLNFNIRNYNEQLVDGTDLDVIDFYNISNASTIVNSQYEDQVNTGAVFFDLNAGWANQVYVGFSGRNEWSSNFAPGNNSFFYPAASASWIFSELWEDKTKVTFGKVRYAFSEVGLAPGPYGIQTYFIPGQISDGWLNDGLGGGPYLGYTTFDIDWLSGNPDLKPERTLGHEVGIDLRFINGRINLDLTGYYQTSKDLLIQRPVSYTSGFQAQWQNIGEMVNRGIEVMLSGDVIKQKGVVWTLTLNGALNRNKVTRLYDNAEAIPLGGFTSIGGYAIEGEPLGVLYSDTWVRDGSGKLVVDDFGYPIIDPKFKVVGNPNPDFTLGVRNEVTWKGIKFNMLWDFRFGSQMWNGTMSMMNYRGTGFATVARDGDNEFFIVDGVKEDGTANDAAIPAVDYWQYVMGITGAGENMIQNAGWIRLRELGISYSYRFESGPFTNMRVSVVGRNLILITDYEGNDPETSLTGSSSKLEGFDYFNTPSTRGVNFSVAFDF